MAAGFVTVGADNKLPAVVEEELKATFATKEEIAGIGSTGGGVTPSPSDVLASLQDFQAGSATIAVAGDSTANDINDFVRLWMKTYMPGLSPETRTEYISWDANTEAYRAPIVDNAGTGTASSGGVIIADDFNRVDADLFNSTSSSGGTWTGASGVWSTDGTHAEASGAGALAHDIAAVDATISADLELVTTGTGATQQWQFCVGGNSIGLSGTRIYGYINVSDVGSVSAGLFKNIGGTSTLLDSTTATGLTHNSATAQLATVAASISIQQVVFTVSVGGTPVTLSGTITESDYAALGTIAGPRSNTLASAGFRMDNVSIETPIVPGTTDTFTLYNGAVAGTTLDYPSTRLATMFPGQIDALIIGAGHNYGDMAPQPFIDIVAAFIADYKALHPESLIGITSQNPEFDPAANKVAHRARQAALRRFAMDNNYEYIPAFEAFTAQPDGGVSLVGSDGVHPTTPPSPYELTEGTGSTLWARTWESLVDARRLG